MIKGQRMPGDSSVAGDSLRAWALNLQAHAEFNNNKLDRALFLAHSSTLKYIDDLTLDADNFHLMATIYKLQNSHDNAIKYYLRAITVYEKLNTIPDLITIYRETGNYFFSMGAYLKAPEYYEKAYNLAKDNEARDLLTAIGICYFNIQDFEKSRNAFEELLTSLSPDAYTMRLSALSHLSTICSKQGNYNQSLLYDKEILEIYRRLNDREGMIAAYNNVAFDYVHSKDYPAAIKVFKESLYLAEQQKADRKELVELYINLGICYQNANDFDNALTNLLKAYTLTDDDPGLLMQRAEIENILAITYYYKSDFYNAELYSRNSIGSARTCHNYELLQSCYYTYSQILKAGNDFINALEYYEMHLALKDSLERGQKQTEQTRNQKNLDIEKTEKEMRLKLAEEEMTEIQLKRMKLESEKKQQELDLLHKQRELEVSENERIMQSLVLTRQQHEAELRNREMKSLEQERAIQELQLKQKEAEQKEQEKEIIVLQAEKNRQSEARKRAIYTAILTTLIGILIFIGLVTTRKKNAVLARQKKEIEEKNDALEDKNQEILTQTEHIIVQKKIIEEKNLAITDSIQYASRIQEAVLTPIEDIRKHFADSFILFRPRDIVSGDFYWCTHKDGKTIIAAADCTGHGVPGAFMSMLGTAFLNEITSDTQMPNASSILDELRKNVIAALRQKGQEGEAQDGMDISLCIIENRIDTINFAGANNPLYQIRNNELTIIKGDRMPIGIHLNSNTPFTNHTIKVEGGDSFYIFSDGMADQFGGPENKKLKNIALQQLLMKANNHPFAAQQKLIENAFDEWKGENEQVDDLLLIGFKVK